MSKKSRGASQSEKDIREEQAAWIQKKREELQAKYAGLLKEAQALRKAWDLAQAEITELENCLPQLKPKYEALQLAIKGRGKVPSGAKWVTPTPPTNLLPENWSVFYERWLPKDAIDPEDLLDDEYCAFNIFQSKDEYSDEFGFETFFLTEKLCTSPTYFSPGEAESLDDYQSLHRELPRLESQQKSLRMPLDSLLEEAKLNGVELDRNQTIEKAICPPEEPKEPKSVPSEIVAETPTAKTFPSPPDLRWEEVTIEFTSDEHIRVRARGNTQTYHFAEIGFKDGRTQRSDSIWGTLREFANRHGEIAFEPTNIDQKLLNQLQKKVGSIRHRLKLLMGINDDPFLPYRQISAYQTKFNLRMVLR